DRREHRRAARVDPAHPREPSSGVRAGAGVPREQLRAVRGPAAHPARVGRVRGGGLDVPDAVDSGVDADRVRPACRVCDLSVLQEVGQAIGRLGLSARGYRRVLKIARSIADLSGEGRLAAQHLAEAIQYRRMDRT
ncbi:MAG: hypothetical protein IT514_06170, partial [Burkholderiales bacterium]|nr:hypothetical protein [Burkholderiales bacterium]